MILTYTQVDNTLGLYLRYSDIMWHFFMLPAIKSYIGIKEGDI